MRAEVAESINSQMWRESTVSNFLNSLFGKKSNENLYICITHSKRNKERKNENFQDMYFPCTPSGIKEAVSHIFSIDKNREIYFRCQVISKKDRNKESAEFLTFIYADIDLKKNTPESNKNYPTKEEVLAMFTSGTIPKPSIIIHTGNGYHCYWILKEPIKAKDYPDLVENFQKAISLELKRNIDSTGDSARILRIPCTYNNKEENNQLDVAITAIGNGETYDSEQFIEQYVSETPLTDTKTGGKVLFQENHATATEKKCRNSKENWIKQDYEYSKNEKQILKGKIKKSPKFKYLQQGEWQIYRDIYESQHRADFGFFRMLAWIFNKNPEKMKACFLKSGLNNTDRVKKKAGVLNYQKYIDRTIRAVLEVTPEEPPAKPNRGKRTGKCEFDRLHGETLLKHNGIVRVYHALIKLERKWGVIDGGRLFASYDRIVEESGVSKPSVKKHLLLLQRLGLIHSLIIGKSNSREKKATELNRTIPIPHKLQGLTENQFTPK